MQPSEETRVRRFNRISLPTRLAHIPYRISQLNHFWGEISSYNTRWSFFHPYVQTPSRSGNPRIPHFYRSDKKKEIHVVFRLTRIWQHRHDNRKSRYYSKACRKPCRASKISTGCNIHEIGSIIKYVRSFINIGTPQENRGNDCYI